MVPEAGLHFLLANACLLVCLFLSLLLYEILSTYAEKQEEAESELRALQLTHQYNAEIQEMYDQMLAWRHDAKNQIATMRAMIEQGGLAESGQFWEKWQGSAPAMPQFSTGCLAVDALLTTKALSMQKAGVDFNSNPTPIARRPWIPAIFARRWQICWTMPRSGAGPCARK